MNQNGSIPTEDTQQPDNAANRHEVAQQLRTTIQGRDVSTVVGAEANDIHRTVT